MTASGHPLLRRLGHYLGLVEPEAAGRRGGRPGRLAVLVAVLVSGLVTCALLVVLGDLDPWRAAQRGVLAALGLTLVVGLVRWRRSARAGDEA